jgi:MFS family permease
MSEISYTAAERRRALLAIIASTIGVVIGFGAVVPLVSVRLEQMGTPPWLIGLHAAMFAMAVMTVGPFLPRILGRFGALRVIYAGFSIAVIATLLMAVLPPIPSWFILRFVMGMALAGHWVATESWINILTTEQNRGKVMALYAMTMAAGFTVGPIVLQQTGTDGALPFVVIAACIGISVTPIFFIGRVTPPISHHGETSIFRIMRLSPLIMLAAAISGFLDMSVYTQLPIQALRLGIVEKDALLMVSLFISGNIFLQLPLGWVADRLGRPIVLIACTLTSLGGALLLPLVITQAIPLYILLFLWGGSVYGLYTLSVAMIGDRFKARDVGVANTAFIMVFELGSTAGPVITGAAMDISRDFGFSIILTLGAVVLLVASLFALRKRRRASEGDLCREA